MNALSVIAPLAGLLAGASVLWVDHALTRRQRGKVSWLSPVLAGGLGLVCAISAYGFSRDLTFSAMIFAAFTALIVAVSTDIRFGLLADLTSLVIAASALVSAQDLTPALSIQEMLISSVLAMGILGLAGLYGRLRIGHTGLGGGDILFAGAIALWCPVTVAAIGIALGAVLTLFAGFAMKAKSQTRLPFAPGLAAGFSVALIAGRLL